MKKSLMERFDDLLSHLNSEENDMALELRADLEAFITNTNMSVAFLEALQDAGVDNWDGYRIAQQTLMMEE
ncbi:hypothetical protein Arno162_15 [Pectobacterium phage Arno162]|uniref:Uncharacterized protein n=1 Tax=Pectobacterium phage Arno162 TaxID=2500577 RepID=A0A679A2J8_9CAUD|nr:hypothetical protein Arno162_15 [Pectobacterium phage Arno162]